MGGKAGRCGIDYSFILAFFCLIFQPDWKNWYWSELKAVLTILMMSSVSVSDLFHLSHYSIGLACGGANYRVCAAEEEERVCTARNVVLISGVFCVFCFVFF